MRFGVVFPQTEIGADPLAIRDFAQAAEALGYQHILAYDHVIGANPASRPGWRPPYTLPGPRSTNLSFSSAIWPALRKKSSWSPALSSFRKDRRCSWPNKPQLWMF